MYYLACQANKNVCRRCNKLIESADEFSIDHIRDWLHSDNPKKLFFDLSNIGFSHKRCNTLAGLDKRTEYRGVTKNTGSKIRQYMARVWNGKTQIFLGRYETAEEAALVVEKYKNDSIRKDMAQAITSSVKPNELA